MKTRVVEGTLSKLPEEHQIGCKIIEERCIELLQAANIQYDRVYWGKANLHNCILVVMAANKKHLVKFGTRALIHQDEEGIMHTVMVRLKTLVKEIKFEEWCRN